MTDSEILVAECTSLTDDVVEAFVRLTPQLSSSNPPPTATELGEIVASPATKLLIARVADTGEIVGSLTLVLFRIPTGQRAWIEDVVVDERMRGQGVGELLNREALSFAAVFGARTVDLTSRPSREVANRLYKRIGFQQRDTNVYRIKLE